MFVENAFFGLAKQASSILLVLALFGLLMVSCDSGTASVGELTSTSSPEAKLTTASSDDNGLAGVDGPNPICKNTEENYEYKGAYSNSDYSVYWYKTENTYEQEYGSGHVPSTSDEGFVWIGSTAEIGGTPYYIDSVQGKGFFLSAVVVDTDQSPNDVKSIAGNWVDATQESPPCPDGDTGGGDEDNDCPPGYYWDDTFERCKICTGDCEGEEGF